MIGHWSKRNLGLCTSVLSSCPLILKLTEALCPQRSFGPDSVELLLVTKISRGLGLTFQWTLLPNLSVRNHYLISLFCICLVFLLFQSQHFSFFGTFSLQNSFFAEVLNQLFCHFFPLHEIYSQNSWAVKRVFTFLNQTIGVKAGFLSTISPSNSTLIRTQLKLDTYGVQGLFVLVPSRAHSGWRQSMLLRHEPVTNSQWFLVLGSASGSAVREPLSGRDKS